MADPVRGTLTWRSGRPLVVFPTKRGTSIPTPVPLEQVAEALAKPQTEPREIELDLEQGRPCRVRPIGSAWREEAGPPTGPQPEAGPGDRRPAGFHNPYGFIRTDLRDKVSGELGDRRPESHSWFAPEKWSGRIGVRLTVETPLLIPDAAAARPDSDDPGHKVYPVRLGPDGRPYLPPTSIKGMLRAAYEAVTNSRLGVFAGHERRLGYRMAAQQGLGMVPGRIVGDGVELLMGTNTALPRPAGNGPGTIMYAAWLPRYRDERFNIRYTDRKFPRHGEAVRFWAELIRHRSGRFSFWEVRRIARAAEALSAAPPPRAGGEVREFTGWVCITNQNINRKHDERVFFADPRTGRPPSGPLTDSLKTGWRDLVQEYRNLHAAEIDRRKPRRPDEYLGHEPGKTAFSRHVYNPDEVPLADGALVYVRLDAKGNPDGLYPVMISRELHPDAPAELLDRSLHPATRLDKLSPADRVFGWVRQSERSDAIGAYRGNLRVGPTCCETGDAVKSFDPPLPLAILGQPKPNQARFYLAGANGAALNGQAVQGAYRKGSNRLQGRKAYPHHATLDRTQWDDAAQDRTQEVRANGTYQEYRRAGGERDDQNRSVAGWVRPGATFAFDIHVTNLSDVELGALLWLLDLSGEGNRRRFHRLGGGKPLGFGSVRLAITGSGLTSGEALAQYYAAFDLDQRPAAEATRLDEAVTAFKSAIAGAYGGGAFERVPFIADFLAAAEGFSDGLPIHYPRVTPQPSVDGENFRWFQENDRGQRAALAPVALDRGLPPHLLDPNHVQLRNQQTNRWVEVNTRTGRAERESNTRDPFPHVRRDS